MQVVSVYGFLVPAVWCPITIRRWEQRQVILTSRWGITLGDATEGSAMPNPSYVEGLGQNVSRRLNPVTEQLEDTYHEGDRKRWVLPCVFFIGVCTLLIPCIITPFIQWYSWSKMAYTCDDPRVVNPSYWINCFHSKGNTIGTDRWVYILCQGIVMGILADVILAAILASGADFLTKKENYRTIGEFEDRKICKRWGFEYVGMYYWFIFLAFVYVPYGKDVQEYLCKEQYMVLGGLSDFMCWTAIPSEMFNIEKIQIDEFFVTPLIATQAINLVLETALPALLQRLRRKAERAVHKDTIAGAQMAESVRTFLGNSPSLIDLES